MNVMEMMMVMMRVLMIDKIDVQNDDDDVVQGRKRVWLDLGSRWEDPTLDLWLAGSGVSPHCRYHQQCHQQRHQ